MKTSTKSLMLYLFLLFFAIDIYTQVPSWKWAKAGTEGEIIQTTTDSVGNTYILGIFTGSSISLGRVNTIGNSSAGVNNIYIAKYASTGFPLWIKSIYGISDSTIISPVEICINNIGEVIVTGTIMNTDQLTVGNKVVGINCIKENLFVAKFFKTGRLLWFRTVNKVVNGVDPVSIPKDALLDDRGNVFLTGYFIADTIDFTAQQATGMATEETSFYAKYNRTGIVEWVNTNGIGGAGSEGLITGMKISEDSIGNVMILGEFSGDRIYYFENDTLAKSGGTDIFFVKYTSEGNYLISNTITGLAEEKIEQVLADDQGNFYIIGIFNSTLINLVGEEKPNSFTNYDVFILKIDPLGNLIWSKTIDTKLSLLENSGFNVQANLDNLGNLYMILYFEGSTVSTGSGDFPNAEQGTREVLVMKILSVDGTTDWAIPGNRPGDNIFNAVSFDRYSNMYFIGDLSQDSIVVDSTTGAIDTVGNGGFYIMKINILGSVKFIKANMLTSTNSLTMKGISVDYWGNIYASGEYVGANSLDTVNMDVPSASGIFTAKFAFVTSLAGNVIDEEGTPVTNGMVNLFGFTRFQRSPLSDSVRIQPDGTYLFKHLPYGRYIILAKPNQNLTTGLLPTYFPSTDTWENAHRINVSSLTPLINYQIVVRSEPLVNGRGRLEGQVYEADTTNIFKSSSAIMKKPLKEVSVLLLSKSSKSGGEYYEAITDENGDFYFDSVPDGDYTLYADVPGLPHDSIQEVTVTDGSYTSNLNYLIGEEEIYPDGDPVTSVFEYHDNLYDIKMYPNPCINKLIIEFDADKSPKNISVDIYNIAGQQISKINLYASSRRINIDVSHLTKGVYFVHFKADNNITENFKVFKE